MKYINEIIQGDCLEVLAELPDKCVDCVITDPPYGMNYLSNWYKYKNPHGRIVGDYKFPTWVIDNSKRIARKAVLIFGRWENICDAKSPKSVIVWVKQNDTAGDLKHEYGRKWECIMFWPLEEHKFNGRPSDVYRCGRTGNKLHPTQKPVELLSWLIRHNSDVGDTILDPFLGSGTTVVAAKQLGRKFIGIEIEEKYCEIARQRLAQDILL